MAKRKKRILQELRQAWGQPIDRIRNFERIKLYHTLARSSALDKTVTSETAADLELDDIFIKIDRTRTPHGSQYLYHTLRTVEAGDDVLLERTHLYDLFRNDSAMRERIQLELTNLDTISAYYLPDVLFGSLPPKPPWYRIIYALSALSVLTILLTLLQPTFFWTALIVITINLFLDHFYGGRFSRHFSDLANLSSLLRSAQILARFSAEGAVPPLDVLKKQSALAASLNSKIGWLTIDKGRLDVLTGALLEYLNQFCLLRLVAWMRAGDMIQRNQHQLREIFEAVGALDLCCGIASFLDASPGTCVPRLNGDGRLRLESAYHPLLGEPVANSLILERTSALFTGSNMAGKTTFVKTVGLNVLLARTLHVCFAAEADIPRVMVCSSIKRADDLSSHKSRYYREIETLLDFIRRSTEPWRHLFIIDEILSSTNTVERIASAASILEYLGDKSITLVTTHDIELRELLGTRYSMYHFAELVTGNDHSFDYRLRPGTSSAHNAIKLLEQIGFPKEITDRANAIARRTPRTMALDPSSAQPPHKNVK